MASAPTPITNSGAVEMVEVAPLDKVAPLPEVVALVALSQLIAVKPETSAIPHVKYCPELAAWNVTVFAPPTAEGTYHSVSVVFEVASCTLFSEQARKESDLLSVGADAVLLLDKR
jgi:hypothetical protein